MAQPTDAAQNRRLHVLFTQEFVGGEGHWIAQCLEYDIAAQGGTLKKAQYEWQLALAARFASAQQLGLHPLEGLPKAPQKFWMLYDEEAQPIDETAVVRVIAELSGPWADAALPAWEPWVA